MQVHVLVVVCLDYELGLLTELGDPKLAHDVLVREVPVSVQEVSLDYVVVLLILLGNVLLETLLWSGAWTLLVITRGSVTTILPRRNTSLKTDWEMLGEPQVFLEMVCSKQLIN